MVILIGGALSHTALLKAGDFSLEEHCLTLHCCSDSQPEMTPWTITLPPTTIEDSLSSVKDVVTEETG